MWCKLTKQIMITALYMYRDKIMKQACYFAKVCDGEFSKSTEGSTYFHCNFVYVNKC